MNDPNDRVALERLIDTYCKAWSEPDAARREAILKTVWAEGATYTDPRASATGIEELGKYIGRVHATRPGAEWLRTSVVDSHHGRVRFAWQVRLADGTLLPEGLDIAEISGEGKIQRIIGFFGPLASKE